MNDESTPKGAPGTGSRSEASLPARYDFEEQHAAYIAGFEDGRREANRIAAEAIAQQLLQDRANEMLGLARREAAQKGPNWLALVTEAAEDPWSA